MAGNRRELNMQDRYLRPSIRAAFVSDGFALATVASQEPWGAAGGWVDGNPLWKPLEQFWNKGIISRAMAAKKKEECRFIDPPNVSSVSRVGGEVVDKKRHCLQFPLPDVPGIVPKWGTKSRTYKPVFFPYQPPRGFGPKGLLMEFRLQILWFNDARGSGNSR